MVGDNRNDGQRLRCWGEDHNVVGGEKETLLAAVDCGRVEILGSPPPVG